MIVLHVSTITLSCAHIRGQKWFGRLTANAKVATVLSSQHPPTQSTLSDGNEAVLNKLVYQTKSRKNFPLQVSKYRNQETKTDEILCR
jgi:hypothetical protein